MIPKITITQVDLLMLGNKPALMGTYLALLCWIGTEMCIKFRNFDSLAKALRFKTRSGVWKSLKKLERIGLIEIASNSIYIKGRGLYYDRQKTDNN